MKKKKTPKNNNNNNNNNKKNRQCKKEKRISDQWHITDQHDTALHELFKKHVVEPADLFVGSKEARGLVNVDAAGLLTVRPAEWETLSQTVDLLSEKTLFRINVNVRRQSQHRRQLDLSRVQKVQVGVLRKVHGGAFPLRPQGLAGWEG